MEVQTILSGIQRLKNSADIIGILLCTETDKTIARYSVLNENKQIFASKYMPYLPTEKELEEEIIRQKALLRMRKDNEESMIE